MQEEKEGMTKTQGGKRKEKNRKKEERKSRQRPNQGNLGHGISRYGAATATATASTTKTKCKSQLKLDLIKLGLPSCHRSLQLQGGDITVGLQPLYLPGCRLWCCNAGKGSLFSRA